MLQWVADDVLADSPVMQVGELARLKAKEWKRCLRCKGEDVALAESPLLLLSGDRRLPSSPQKGAPLRLNTRPQSKFSYFALAPAWGGYNSKVYDGEALHS